MGIHKADLKEFIEEKAKKRKAEVRKVVRAAVEETFRPFVFAAHADLGVLETKADAFHRELDRAVNQNKRLTDWNFTSLLRDVNRYAIGIREDIVQRQTNIAVGNLLDRCTDVLVDGLDTLSASVADQHSMAIAEYQDLIKLTDELTTIINSSHSGDKAYKRLKELGVNLSDFDGGSKILPAVVKLSVNPCLINGDCK
ncbi:hypothetical protein [Cohnella nanjingensis]|uniref:Uncharacterized protein n=1 Tax=Cohnella nanjingensis TaxID=1387779 RepID=A0A7X0VDS7_9BACL|nr:hypothetical protein [Cohnella nanjingensis]MBB6670255.1 hypothetical protein [Cohnella nanjingensis]